MARSHCTDESGFSIVEVLVATLVLSVGLLSVAQLFAVSTKGNTAARSNTFTVMLAQQKMEQLRGLTWSVGVSGLPISDTATDTAAPIEMPTGGTGLSHSPGNTLTSNTNGWVDYVDRSGNVLGGGIATPPGAVYVRRWAVEPLPSSPSDTIAIRVLVRPIGRREDDSRMPAARWPDEARLVSIKTRKAQ